MIWCLHGAVGMSEDWDDFGERMAAAGHRVCAVDLWGFVENSGCSFDEFGRALNERIRKNDTDPVLLGYSLGGRLALHALLESSVPWRAGVIVSAHPGLKSRRERVLRMAADAEWAALALTGDWREFLAKWNAQAVFGGCSDRVQGEREQLELRRQAVARGFIEWSLGKQENLRTRLPDIACPLLWITGREDARFSRIAREAKAESLHHAFHHLSVECAGHRVPWQQPATFAALVHQFLA